MKFPEVIGQEDVKRHLQSSLAFGKISHAYLISGEAGMGKLKLAQAFAKALLCEENGEHGTEGCGKCHSCKQIEHHNHPDVHYVTHEKPTHISVDEAREQIVHDVAIRPYQSRYKVYLIPDAEILRIEAQNAILKTIEEPPDYAIILLLAKNEESLLQTIRSRCVKLQLRAVSDSVLRQHLTKEYRIPDYQVASILAFAQGNPGRAEDFATSDEFRGRRQWISNLLSRLPEQEPYEWQEAVSELAEKKQELGDYFALMMDWYRDLLFCKAGLGRKYLIFQEKTAVLERLAEQIDDVAISRTIKKIEQTEAQILSQVNTKLALENLFITIGRN